MAIKTFENRLAKHPFVPWLLFLLGLLAFYGGTLSFGFTYDDHLLVRSYAWEELIGKFSQPWGDRFYRPLINFVFAGEFALFSHHAWLYHSMNLLLISAALFVFFRILLHLQLSPFIAFLSGLLWGFLPGNAVLCSWISTRTDSVCLIFYLLALLFFLRTAKAKEMKLVDFILSLIFSALAYLSKENAVTLPLLMTAYWFTRARRQKQLWPLLILHYVLLFSYLLLRWHAFGTGLIGTRGLSQESFIAQNFLLSAAGMIARYIEALISCFYPLFLMPNILTASLLLITVMVFFYWSLYLKSFDRKDLLWISWLFITALPNSFDASPRLLWLPTLAAVVLLVNWTWRWLSASKSHLGIGIVVVSIYLLGMAEINGMVQNCFTQPVYQSTLQYQANDRRRWPFSDLGQMRYKMREKLLQFLQTTHKVE